jgi:RNA polymerase sigma factor (sigma-70 family)
MADSAGGAADRSALPPLETTTDLLERVRRGDERARDRLMTRVLPPLRAWAHQRLPRRARDLSETDDLLQVTLVRALRHLDSFENRGEGALLAYLRQILLNVVRDEVRRTSRREPNQSLDAEPLDPGPSLVEEVVGRETLARYEAGLGKLTDEQREAVILKVEMGYSNPEIAEAIGRPSGDAARVFVARALAQLAEAMRERP